MRTPRLYLTAILLSTALSLPVQAQVGDNREVYDQLDKLERDVMTLQRQVARGEPVSAADLPEGNDAARLEVRLTSLEEEIRRVRGKLEENEFQIKKLNDTFTRFQHDNDFRLTELEKRPASAVATPTQAAVVPADKAADKSDKVEKPSGANESAGDHIDTSSEASIVVKEGDEKPASTAGDGVLKAPSKDAAKDSDSKSPDSFETPRDHYNYAFRLLNQTKYDDAAKYFKSFTEKYKKDPLIGNAYYWLGETHYIRRDYVQAADSFREGFEVLPNGPKAADNLLKLSMSLASMKKTKDACTVLNQIVSRFKDSSQAVTKKAESEYARIGCK